MIHIFYLIGLFLFINGIYQIIKYLITVRNVKNNFFVQRGENKNAKNEIFILAPVLYEEATVASFLDDLCAQDYPKKSYKVYVITTGKEYLKKTSPNTIEIIEKMKPSLLERGLDFTHLHYPNNDGYKADQLNFAYREIIKKYGDEKFKNSFFFLLDADSKVTPNTLGVLNSNIEDGVEIYQQPLLWFKNIEKLNSLFMRSFAFLQSYFSVSYEMPMFAGSFFPYRLKYFVGHGLCLKGSFLFEAKGFPEIIEDVRLGRFASFLNAKVKLIPNFGIVETAKSFSVYLKQSSVWFFGCGLFMEDYKKFCLLKKNDKKSIRNHILILHGYFKSLRWLNKGLLHLLGFIVSIVYREKILFLIFGISLLFNSAIPVLLVSVDFRNIWCKNFNNKKDALLVLFQSVVFSPIMYMLNFMGPFYGLFKLFNFYLWGKIQIPKTER